MIRMLISLPVLVVLLGVGTIYFAYGQIDPCRVLAVERARRANASMTISLGHLTEDFTRFGTSQMSEGACVKGLFRSWRERLAD